MTLSSASLPRRHLVSSSASDRLQGTGQRRPGRNIFVFCDGTGKDGVSEDEVKHKPTNVYRAYLLVSNTPEATKSGQPVGPDGRARLVHYVPGVGAGSTIKNPTNILARVLGATIVESIVDAYLYISQNYQEEDDIYLFGYSRGGFVARKVASLIYRIGLGFRDRITLLKALGKHEKPIPWNSPWCQDFGKNVRIKCLVAWDTVVAVFTKQFCFPQVDLLGIPDSELPPNVDYAFHAMAFHENRKLFRATLFEPNLRTKLKEVWFPGAHADVGGGGKLSTGLPDISLLWVIGEMASFQRIESEKITYPDLNIIIPTDAYHESSLARRAFDRCETRLESKLLKPNSVLHESVVYLRNPSLSNLDPRGGTASHILTINDLHRINLDINANLVSNNTFESLKRSASLEGRKFQDKYRSRFPSMQGSIAYPSGRAPRHLNTPLPPSSLRHVAATPRACAASVALPTTQHDHHAPISDTLQPRRRSRQDSAASSRRYNLPPASPVPIAHWSAIDSSSGNSDRLAIPEVTAPRSHRPRVSSRASQVSVASQDFPAERRHRSGRERVGGSRLNQQMSLAA